MRQSSPVSPRLRPRTPSVRSTPSSVTSVSPSARPPHPQPAARQQRQVVGVGGLPQLEHHVVRRVHHVVDRAHAGQEQALGDPARRRPDHDVVEHRHREAGAQVGRLDRRRRRRLDRPPARRRVGRLRRVEREAEARRQVAGDPDHGPGVGAVALDRDVEDDVGLEPQRLGERACPARPAPRRPGSAGRRRRRRARAPSPSTASRWTRRRASCGGRSRRRRAGWHRPERAAPGPPPRSCAPRTRSRAARPRRRRRRGGSCRRP